MKTKLIKKEYGYVLGVEDKLGTRLIAVSSQKHQEILDKLDVVCEYKLSLKNCQAIELGYDLDELFQREIDELMFTGNLEDPSEYRSGMYKGVKIFLELMGDKKFSEEDMLSFESFVSKWYDKAKNVEEFTALPSELLVKWKSLQQTEWDVEVLMENSLINGYRNQAEGTIGFIAEYESVPKLDADGCLILKRI